MPRPPGRPAKPIEVHRRAGNPSKKHLPEPVKVVAMSKPPRAPQGLRRPGRKLWRTLWGEAGAWLAPSDLPLVVMLCEAEDERADLRQVVAEEGRTFTTKTGYVAPHPVVGQLRSLEGQMTTWLSMLGLSPSDRARLGLAEVRRVGHLEELKARREARLGR
ncbi:MAG TPA: phage terminase small subunit P27 family [Actinomycetota bacterium]|nr:phage terminase small subunit P27 family [Actinomycetota bacterium]